MSLAEQKEKLHKVIDEADETMTAQLLELLQQIELGTPSFSKEDFAEFQRRSEEHRQNPGSAMPWEESMAHIRRKLRQ